MKRTYATSTTLDASPTSTDTNVVSKANNAKPTTPLFSSSELSVSKPTSMRENVVTGKKTSQIAMVIGQHQCNCHTNVLKHK